MNGEKTWKKLEAYNKSGFLTDKLMNSLLNWYIPQQYTAISINVNVVAF